jgi:hypothetical protein
MSSYYNNNNNLVKYGMKGEIIAKFYIEYVNKETFIKFNHNDEYDLLSNKSTYEIKTDSNFIKYNSVFIEFESNKKESGINKSKADYYIFVCPSNKNFEIVKIFQIETNILKELIQNNIFLVKNALCKDYYNNVYSINTGYIIPEHFLLKYGSSYEIILNEYENLKNLLN